MEALKIDTNKLVKVSTFAREKGVSVQQVYNWIKDGKENVRCIDGVKFIIRG